jgi:hypothetical protein
VVAGGLGGLALAVAGCDAVDRLLGESKDSGVSPAPGATVSPTAPADDADSALVDKVVAVLSTTAALATQVGTRVPALTRVGARLARLHDAHVRELGGTPASGTRPPKVAAGRRPALSQLLAAEAGLQDQLVAAAQSAQSGALAQLLASMAAAVAQQRAVLG